MNSQEGSLARAKPLFLPSWLGGACSLLLAAAVVYIALFSTYPPVHDAMHKARHALAIVPCH
jgi:cobalt transporter subunit CbtB